MLAFFELHCEKFVEIVENRALSCFLQLEMAKLLIKLEKLIISSLNLFNLLTA